VAIGLSEKAKHPRDRLYPLHGSLLDIKCSNRSCGYIDKENRSNPILDALAESSDLSSYTPETIAIKLSSLSLNSSKPSDPKEEDPKKPKYERTPNPLEAILESLAPTVTPEMHKEVIPLSKLPRCPKCSSLLRPGVVWFGESLSQSQFDEINAWIDRERKLDLMMVVGTRAEVFPAARFVQTTKEKGARIAVINLDGSHLGGHHLRKQDWLFEGDAAEVLDVLFDGILQN
jgi:NAD-dependent deacetylase sirtuin 5